MADLPHPWGTYAQAQAQLSRRTRSNHHAEGLEAGLNRFLEQGGQLGNDLAGAMDRAIANGARRSRYIGRMHALGRVPVAEGANPSTNLEARADLARLGATLDSGDMKLLTAVGMGHDYQRLSNVFGGSEQALRAKVSRSRRAARLILSH